MDMLVSEAAHTNTILKILPTKQDVEITVDSSKSELEVKNI